jgi:cytochrome c oxidase cbb3-type subunit 3
MLFQAYNCNGCHANGGGGMGPALMNDKWIYGSDPANISATILEARPNGMPTFRGLIPEEQVWQLAAYVRSMSGLLRKDVAPGRQDHMSGKAPESSTEKMTPKDASMPPAAELSR